jgi:hypothetical protein
VSGLKTSGIPDDKSDVSDEFILTLTRFYLELGDGDQGLPGIDANDACRGYNLAQFNACSTTLSSPKQFRSAKMTQAWTGGCSVSHAEREPFGQRIYCRGI